MSSVDAPRAEADRPPRRVREQVKDGVAVIAASLAASTAVVVILTLVTKLAG